MTTVNIDVKSLYYSKLSPSEFERLALLLEELGETQQAIGKILRHGYESYNPDDSEHNGNREDLIRELGHVIAAIQIMIKAEDFRKQDIKYYKDFKLNSFKPYLHHNK